MDTNSYEVHRASLTPNSVQPLTRGAGKKVEPIEFNLTEHTDTANDRLNLWEDICIRADEFRLWLATQCCACLSSVPSFALVIIAAVLIMLLIATIPLAFALTYISPQASTAEDSFNDTANNIPIDRFHLSWFNGSGLVIYQDWDDQMLPQTTSLLPKKIVTCSVYGFACTGKPHIVIPKNRRCDGYPDCEDGSDELDCHECQTTLSCPASVDKRSGRKLCLVGGHLCDNHTHCSNGEDETIFCRHECQEGEHKCRDMDICIPAEAVCDGEKQCPFGDDEENCNGNCNNGAKFCDGKICVAKRMLCDGSIDCQDGNDEKDCDCASCSGKNSVLCDGPEKFCISKGKICNGHRDCPGGEDEDGCPGICPLPDPIVEQDEEDIEEKIASNDLVRCADGRIYGWEDACNGLRQQCRQSCSKCNPEMAFQCASELTQRMSNLTVIGFGMNTTTDEGDESLPAESASSSSKLHVQRTYRECIHRSLICDGKPDCTADGSDEVNCECGPNSMECAGRSMRGIVQRRCYSDSQKCDGYSDCAGGDDERNCAKCKNGAFLCQSEKRCIPSSERCDGKDNCRDKSDEENCTCQECARHGQQMYLCSGSARCFPLDTVCDPHSMCPNATKLDKMFCAVRDQEYF